MIDKRLINLIGESKKYIAGNVVMQWLSLAANIVMMGFLTQLLAGVYEQTVTQEQIVTTILIALAAIAVRFLCAEGSTRMSYLSSKTVKQRMREMIYEKLLRLGTSYLEHVQTSEVVQLSVEGADQLETYFGAYLPQFFYAMLAPLTLFVVMSFVSIPAAVVLLICVPLIPMTIVVIQKWAKKMLAKYWGQYTALGDTFLENLQGLTTLKIYQSDAFKNDQMNEEAEKFRGITMKVLTMQMNSITIMDLIAYGGAALGAIMAVTQFKAGNTDLAGTLFIIVLAADFFIPMRQLGSYFHVAMNGMAAGDKIFRLLDLPEESQENKKQMTGEGDIVCKSLCFSYTKEREILHGLDLSIKKGSFCAIVGESGCGKSTVAAILMGRKKDYQGSVRIDGMEAPPHCVSAAGRAGQDKNAARWSGSIELRDISEESLLQNMAYVSHQSYLFRGTVRDNLLMGKPEASEEELWQVLEQVKLADFLRAEDGLDTKLLEQGSNLSGGQRQRLALARALLFDAKVYIFDEATSNIDVESENDIMENICALAGQKTVILISHRLANVVSADQIYVLEDGSLAESGTHKELLKKQGAYAKLWNTQMELENFGNIRMSSVNSDGSGYPEAERMGKKRGEQI